MSLGTWVEQHVVKPAVAIVLQPENLAKIADAMGSEIKDVIFADNDRVILAVRQDVNAIGADLATNIDKVGDNLTANINSVVDNLFHRISGLIPGAGWFMGGDKQ